MKKEVVNIFNADNEEPKCCRCDYCGCEFMCEDCGPEHGWQNYERKEFLDLEEDDFDIDEYIDELDIDEYFQ